jgi:hypothetical protein
MKTYVLKPPNYEDLVAMSQLSYHESAIKLIKSSFLLVKLAFSSRNTAARPLAETMPTAPHMAQHWIRRCRGEG